MMKNWLKNSRFYADGPAAVGLLFLRIFAGYAMAQHGLGKIQHPFSWMGDAVPAPLQFLAAASEFFGGIGLIFGLLTPIACFGIMSTMFVATLFLLDKGAVMVANDPKTTSFESSGLYFFIALCFFLNGPGYLSVDHFIFGRQKVVEKSP